MRCGSTAGLSVDVIHKVVARVHDVAKARGLDFTRHKVKLYKQVVICLMLFR